MEGVEDLEVQAPKNSPAYGARNVSIVATGTGEALPGPATCERCCWSVALYNQ
jgi:ABC-type tungstate transport system permease subunit